MLTVAEVAKMYNVCEETVRRHAKRYGGVKFGRTWAFKLEDLPGQEGPCTVEEKSGGPPSVEYASRLGLRSRGTRRSG